MRRSEDSDRTRMAFTTVGLHRLPRCMTDAKLLNLSYSMLGLMRCVNDARTPSRFCTPPAHEPASSHESRMENAKSHHKTQNGNIEQMTRLRRSHPGALPRKSLDSLRSSPSPPIELYYASLELTVEQRVEESNDAPNRPLKRAAPTKLHAAYQPNNAKEKMQLQTTLTWETRARQPHRHHMLHHRLIPVVLERPH